MSNQGDNSNWPLEIQQIKWAMRNGQKINGLEDVIQGNQPVILPANQADQSIAQNTSLGSKEALEEKFDKLGQYLNEEIVAIKDQFGNLARSTVLEEQFTKLGQYLNEEILSVKNEFTNLTQYTALEEEFSKLSQCLNEEILSIKNKLTSLAHSTALEEEFATLHQYLNEEILAIKKEFESVAQGTVLEEQFAKLGQYLNEEILAIKKQFENLGQSTVLEEQMDKLGQSLSQEIALLKSEFTKLAQGTALEEQLDKLTKLFEQEILALRNEFSMFVQTQLNQEKIGKIAETEWKSTMEEREARFQSGIQELQQNVLSRLEKCFRHVDEKLQHHEKLVQEEISLVTVQMTEWYQFWESREKNLDKDWQKKLEEKQTQLTEDINYIRYVLEEIATRPQGVEAQQKLRENYIIREIAVLKEEIAGLAKQWKTMKIEYSAPNAQQLHNSSSQQETDSSQEKPTRVYKRKKRRGY